MYEVIGVSKHSETLEKLVVYRALYGENELWVRPLKMFLEEVEVDGKKVPRFEFMGKFKIKINKDKKIVSDMIFDV